MNPESIKNWAARAAQAINDEIDFDRVSREQFTEQAASIIAAHAEPRIEELEAEIVQWKTNSRENKLIGEENSGRVDKVEGKVEALVALLRESKREHSDGEDIDCPMANPTFEYNKGEPCTCGADTWNARINAALGEI
jgi:hypothetical protein